MATKSGNKNLFAPRNIILGVVVIILLFAGIKIFKNRQQALSLEQPVASAYTFSSTLINGTIQISESESDSIQVKNTYKASKPTTDFNNNVFEIKSTNNNREERSVALPRNFGSTIKVDVGNGTASINARNLNISSAEINVGNGNLTYTLSVKAPHIVKLGIGNGNLAIQLPRENDIDGLRINFENVPAVPEMNLGKTFIKTETGYDSVGYVEGGNNTVITVSGGNYNITVDSIE